MAIVKRSIEELEKALSHHQKELDNGIADRDFNVIEPNLADIERIRDELHYRKQEMRKMK